MKGSEDVSYGFGLKCVAVWKRGATLEVLVPGDLRRFQTVPNSCGTVLFTFAVTDAKCLLFTFFQLSPQAWYRAYLQRWLRSRRVPCQVRPALPSLSISFGSMAIPLSVFEPAFFQ